LQERGNSLKNRRVSKYRWHKRLFCSHHIHLDMPNLLHSECNIVPLPNCSSQECIYGVVRKCLDIQNLQDIEYRFLNWAKQTHKQ